MTGQGDVRRLPIVHSGTVNRQEDGRRGNWPLPLKDELAGRELHQPISRHDVKKKEKKKSDNQSNQDQTERLCNEEGLLGVVLKHSTQRKSDNVFDSRSKSQSESDLQPQS